MSYDLLMINLIFDIGIKKKKLKQSHVVGQSIGSSLINTPGRISNLIKIINFIGFIFFH